MSLLIHADPIVLSLVSASLGGFIVFLVERPRRQAAQQTRRELARLQATVRKGRQEQARRETLPLHTQRVFECVDEATDALYRNDLDRARGHVIRALDDLGPRR